MDSDEKKVKLDELPDEGSEIPKPAPKLSSRKITIDPRLKKLSQVDDEKKVELMKRSWVFDDPDWSLWWVVYILVIVGVRMLDLYPRILENLESGQEDFFGFLGVIASPGLWIAQILFYYTPVFLIFLPFFTYRTRSEFYLEISFDGLSTVKKIKVEPREMVQRIFVKWNEIIKVKKLVAGGKEKLELYSHDGKLAEIPWIYPLDKRRGILVLLKGLVSPDHPLRELLEKEMK